MRMEMNNLQLGDTGDSVKILQEKLKILGFYNALITGIFGVSTEVGVRTFQRLLLPPLLLLIRFYA